MWRSDTLGVSSLGMEAVIISCGTELTTGQCVDTNSAWMSAQLTLRGIRVVEHVTVDDDVERLAEVVRRSLSEAQWVLVSGGLGPTADDVAREAIAAALGAPLEESPEALQQIRKFFEHWQRAMPESNRGQARVPQGCTVIPNPKGTAPGIEYVAGERRLFAFPGIPGEMKAMFEAAVVPLLPGERGGAGVEPAVLRCYGISEAKLGEILADLMRRGRNPSVGTTASQAILSVRVVASGPDNTEGLRRRDADLSEIRRRLGDVVFGAGDATLEGVVGEFLRKESRSLSTAESCTGGGLAKRLTDVPGSSAYFLRGYITYSNASKSELLGVPKELLAAHGAISEEVARAMADGCRRAAATDYALSITGIAGPTGGNPPEKPVGLVYIALADGCKVDVTRVLLGEHLTREEIRDRACKSALNILRLRLLERV